MNQTEKVLLNTETLTKNQYGKWDKMTIVAINTTDILMLLDGHKIKRTSKKDLPFHMDIKPITKQELQQAINNSDHKSDWWSMLHAEMIINNILK